MPVFCMEPMDMLDTPLLAMLDMPDTVLVPMVMVLVPTDMVDTDIPPMVTTARGLLMLSQRLMLMPVFCTVPMDMVDMLDMDTLLTPTVMLVPMAMDTQDMLDM